MNADAAGGRIRVQLRNAQTGEVLPGMGFADCEPLTADGLRQQVRWRHIGLTDAAGKVVRLEFELRDADLFAFGAWGQSLNSE